MIGLAMVISDMVVRYGKLSLSLSLSSVRAIIRSAIRGANGLALATVLLASAALFAQETLPPPYQRDGEIYFDSTPVESEAFGGATGASHCIQLNRFVEFRGMNRRTVGNGRIGQTVDENGALLNPEALIEDGLLARKAFIRVTTFGKDAMKSGERPSWVAHHFSWRLCQRSSPE